VSFICGSPSVMIATYSFLTSGMRLVYLPPYSPDFNPIEEGFSAIKAWICSNRDYVRGELSGEATCDPYEMLWEAVFSAVTPDKARGWFKDCGYL
jgi:DDE superfamily endonuclease